MMDEKRQQIRLLEKYLDWLRMKEAETNKEIEKLYREIRQEAKQGEVNEQSSKCHCPD